MAARVIDLEGRLIGPGQPCFVIAEAGVNHGGDVAAALALIDAAAAAGADAVKFQTFRAERLVTATAPKAAYQVANTGDDGSQLDMLRRLELEPDDHRALRDRAESRGLLFLSTPFDEECADLLDGLGVPAIKMASGELTNLPFLAHVARKGKPILLSTGMALLGEVEAAVHVLEEEGNEQFVLLHCVSDYPARPQDVHLRCLATLAGAFDAPVGYSDHTLGPEVALAAVALGACVLEKHFTLSRTLPGPDHQASLEPMELAELVRGVRKVEAALGQSRKRPSPRDLDTAAVARKSLVAAVDLPEGSVLTTASIAVRRPGTGLPPAMIPHLVGRRLRTNVTRDTLLRWDMIS